MPAVIFKLSKFPNSPDEKTSPPSQLAGVLPMNSFTQRYARKLMEH